MISCQKCEFKILPKMRFALVKNFCPSCGGTLLSELDSHEINLINKRLQSQEFIISLSNQLSKDLIQNLIYDLSIFIKFDLQKEQARSEISLSSAEEDIPSQEGTDDLDKIKKSYRPISRAESSQTQTPKARDIQSLRRALEDDEDESDDDSDEESDFDSNDEEVDERVKRLKKVYASSPTLKKFGGISRSE